MMATQTARIVDIWGNPDEVISIEPLTRQDVDRAWDESTQAADLYWIATMREMPRDVIEQRREEMMTAARHAEKVQEMYFEQVEAGVA
jgi:hypothetical protein